MNDVVSIPATCLPKLLLPGSPVWWNDDFGVVDFVNEGTVWVFREDRDTTGNPAAVEHLHLCLRYNGVPNETGIAHASLALARKLGATDAYAALWEQYECGDVQQANLTAIGPSGRQVYRFSGLVPDPIEALAGVCRGD